MLSHSRFLTAAATAALAVLVAAPAWAEEEGSGLEFQEQAPTRELGTDSAAVLADGLAYATAGGGLGGYTLGYTRGLGHNSEIGVGATGDLKFGGATALGVNLGLDWKQLLMSSDNFGVGLIGTIFAGGIGGTTVPGVSVGLPLTFGVAKGALTAEPRVMLGDLTKGTSELEAEVSLGLHYPLSTRWALMLDVAPGYKMASSSFEVPVAVGARFSPTAHSHVDLEVGQVNPMPTFGGSVGLVSVLGHVGF